MSNSDNGKGWNKTFLVAVCGELRDSEEILSICECGGDGVMVKGLADQDREDSALEGLVIDCIAEDVTEIICATGHMITLPVFATNATFTHITL